VKKIVSGFVIVLVLLFVLACASASNTNAAGSGDNLTSGKEKSLAQIYDQYNGEIVLTGAKTYVVAKGDTLSRIARNNYGAGDNPYYFPLIIAASKDSADIIDPDEIEVGMQLIIPDLQENLNNPAARDNLKHLLKDIADYYSQKTGPQSTGLYDGLTRLYNTL
jgi:hypothetical protein